MGIIEKIFSRQIISAANRQLANMYNVNRYLLDGSLPTINYDGADYESIYKSVGSVYEVTDLLCKKVINAPIVMYKVKDGKRMKEYKKLSKIDPVGAYVSKTLAIEEVDIPEIRSLLERPNSFQNDSQFIWTVALNYLLRGNSYIYGNKVSGKPKELYCFPDMDILVDSSNLLNPIKGYRLKTADAITFDKSDIYHIKTATPSDIDSSYKYLYGVSPLRAYLENVRTFQEANKQSSKIVKNGGAFGILGAKHKEDALSKEQKDQLYDKIREARASNDDMARIFATSNALEWTPIGLPSSDLQLIELIGASSEAIYRAYHVPLQFLNQKASTSNNQATAVRQLIYDAVYPLCESISVFLTDFIGKHYGNVIIELDYTQLPEMAVNMGEVAKYLSTLPKGVLTYNEMRYIMKYGEKDLPYMNEHYVESGLVRLSDIGQNE